MRILTLILIVAAVAVRAEIPYCPKHCNCTSEGTSGTTVICTRLSLEDQEFRYPVQHLTVIPDAHPIELTDDIFAQLGLKNLESLKIAHSPLSDISVKAFHGLSSLMDINLSNNQLFLIHGDTFANNTNLKHLKLSGNPMQLMQVLESTQPYLLRSASLSELDLSNCSLAQILPKTFSELRNLIIVNLSGNLLKTIPKNLFDCLEILEDVDLSSNKLHELDKDTFKQNKELSALRLARNPIESLKGLDLPVLEELDLSYCKLHILMKESLEGMPHLTILNLSSNLLELISDDSFEIFSELKKLDLSNNKLLGPLAKDLFNKNRDLEELSLSGNRELGSFVGDTGFIGDHIAMKTLEIADCGLLNLSAAQLQGMENLNVLNVSHNQISELDDSTFKHLKRLNTLDLSYNRLETLSVQLFEKNTELVRLKLSGNPLKRLPLAAFSNMPTLTFLGASKCELEQLWSLHALDEASHGLPQLASLDISSNKLRYLHKHDFFKMKQLKRINLEGNPLECVTSTIEAINYIDSKQIELYHQNHQLISNQEMPISPWKEFVMNMCPSKDHNQIQIVRSNEKIAKKVISAPVTVLGNSPAYTSVGEIVVETDSGAVMWPMVLAVSILIVALYFIIYLVGEITHRRRAITASYARAGALGGHIRSRDASGSPLYYKLYEECSVPTQPTRKKGYVLDFSPIHTILKKNNGTYKVMRNNEANV